MQMDYRPPVSARLHAMKRAPMMPGIMARVLSPAVLLLVVWAAVSPVEAAAPASSSHCISPFPAFVTHRPPPASSSPTPRCRQRNSNNNGAATAKVGWQWQPFINRNHGCFNSRLHQSTVAVAEPQSRNSTHEAAVTQATATAFAFDNASTATTAPITTARIKHNKIPKDSLPEDMVTRAADDSDSDFVEPDDRHAEGVDALANYFAPRSSDISNNISGSGGGNNDNIDSNNREPINSDDDQEDDQRRAHALAPPGYGKTLLALQTMAELRARGEPINTALYVVPTITLVDQALAACDEYGIFRDVPHKRMIVASKTSRKEKRTTKAGVIAEFLESSLAHNETSFLACTYKSLHRVGEALRIIQQRRGLDSPPSIDFATFDEAHNTEGCAETTAYGLYDDNIFIHRRLFVTGTAKNYTDTPQRRQVLGSKVNGKDGSRSLVTKRSSPEQEDSDRIKARSFRNRDLYGPCLFRRTNQDCVDNNITVPVKLCCLSKKEMFSELGREFNISSYTRDEIIPFAIMAAYSKLNTAKGVSFHSLVARSEEFVELAKPLFEEAGFYISHVNGKMRAAEQERRLTKARSVAKSHMANCQLWREGVDVPEWDLVVVADAVSNHVIAQQIIGRVSRRHPGKECGHVFIPDLFDEDNGIEVGSEGYDAFVSIFQAMMADDPLLEKDVLFVSGENAGNRTLDVTEYPTRLKERFQLPASVPLPIQQEFIRNIVVEVGGGTRKDSVWMGWYNLLKKYKERRGDCLVPHEHVEEGKRLGRWVSEQRSAVKNGRMTSGCKGLLDEIGFCWDVGESAWQEHYALLKKYKEREGDCLVHQEHVEEGRNLGRWANRQREALKNGSMTSGRKELLDEIGFCWDVRESLWQENYGNLKAYWELNGHCMVKNDALDNDNKLYKWIQQQRNDLKKGRLTAERKGLLDEIGFCWDVLESVWQENYATLKAYWELNGHCMVSNNKLDDDNKLYRWMCQQRDDLKKGKLTAERKGLLDEIGFCWDVVEYEWECNLNLLEKYAKREGHCNVPFGHLEDGENLGRWLNRQRASRKKGTLSQSRQERLEKLGVIWNPKEVVNNRSWVNKYDLLVKFKEREGHCRVPIKHVESGENLGQWLRRQKEAHKKGELDPERFQKLDELGVEW